MRGTNAIIALFLSFIFIITSFGASPETMLIGKWTNEWAVIIEFVKDGILIIQNQSARYRIIDKERVEFDMTGVKVGGMQAASRRILRFTVSDDELILTPLDNPNDTDKFRRVKVDASGKSSYEYFLAGNMNYYNQRNYEQAIKDYERAIQIDPNWTQAYGNIAACYSIQNNGAMACQWLKKAIEKGYKNWDFILKNKVFDNIRNTSCYQEIIKSR